jgi:hypothetical protein
MLSVLEQPIKRYLDARYGVPTDPTRQYQFYRCELCRGLVTWKQILQGGCKCGVGSRVRAAHITAWEKVQLLVTPWRF